MMDNIREVSKPYMFIKACHEDTWGVLHIVNNAQTLK